MPVFEQDVENPPSKWEALRQELRAEGKTELVDLIDELIRNSHGREAAKILDQITSRLDDNLRI
ncbi:MAG: hypothetical protein HWE23_01665 [Rhodobacteraceae bacterium]|nr:hypothetical protein [Paracoccaceae bacterium]